MPFIARLFAALCLMTLAATSARAGTVVYVSNADSQEISVLSLDRATGTVAPLQTLAVGGTVMPMALSPDRKLLYAALRSQPYRVVTMAIEPDGRLRKLGEASLADSMAYIATDRSGRWLFAASYGGNKITVNATAKDGQAGAVQQVQATAPNAHSIQADASNRYVLATSLGGDNVSVWRFDADKGLLSANEPPLATAPAKSGPRHLRFDAQQRFAYLLCELDASLHVFAYDAQRGTLREVQALSALPPGFGGKPWAADLHLTPDGRFLYASERGSNTLAAFKVDAGNGMLQLVGHTPTEKTPRGFAIDPSGRYLLAVGQESHAMSVYAIDAQSGALKTVQQIPLGKNPNWVEIVDLP
jgi:6-phosphogluconolactonase